MPNVRMSPIQKILKDVPVAGKKRSSAKHHNNTNAGIKTMMINKSRQGERLIDSDMLVRTQSPLSMEQ